MKELQKYEINILKLSEKQHVYTFESGDSFFESFDQQLLRKGHIRTHLELDKSSTMIQLNFWITGTVELICDRTLDPFDHPLDIKQKLILKYGEENKELTDEIEMIERDKPSLNVAHYIFEYIGLSLPMKKLHPRLADQPVEAETEEGLLVYRSDKADDNEQENSPVDPRWEALQKLKGESNNNN